MVVGNSKVALKGKSAKAIKIVKASSVVNTSSVENEEKENIYKKQLYPKVDGVLTGKK